jgi:Domain of unknown function (DUF4404)
MDPHVLRDHLTKLHEELGSARSVDPQTNRLLGEIMDDIKRLMAASSSAAPGSAASGAAAAGVASNAPSVAAEDLSLPDRLERIAVQFEVDHPTLAASSRRLVDLLGKAGL